MTLPASTLGLRPRGKITFRYADGEEGFEAAADGQLAQPQGVGRGLTLGLVGLDGTATAACV